jgi:tetratricopeptide (TPR) repeat protein
MKRKLLSAALAVFLQALCLHAQTGKIVIAAGTPEDVALQAITNEPDAQKRLGMYQDFVQKFSANPIAVTYGNWQIAQYYQGAGDPQKALEYGDKALLGAPDNLDILVLQASLAQQIKDNAKVMDYSLRGGNAFNAMGQPSKPEGGADDASAEEKAAIQNAHDFLEGAAFNAIVDETNPKTRMEYIERFTPAFPNSKYADPVASYAMVALSQLKDMPRMIAYAEKALATNPNSLPALLLLANAYADDPKPGSTAKAVTYAQKAIAVAKADAPDADRSHKASAGVAHSTLGYAYLKQDKTAPAIPELKAATVLLRGQDEQSFALAAYRLGFAYAKLRRINEARDILMEAVKIQGPVQPLSQDLLTKVNAARASGK